MYRNNTLQLAICFLLVFLLCLSCIHKKQILEVPRFEILQPATILDSAGIRIQFDVLMKEFIINEPEYEIRAELFDNDSNRICINEDVTKFRLTGSKETWDSLQFNITQFIPFDKIDIPAGRHQVQLKLIARGEKFTPQYIYSKAIQIDKPQLYQYEDQDIIIRDKEISDKDREIYIDFDFDLKFKSYQTIGIYNDPDLHYCYLMVKLENKKNKKSIELIYPKHTLQTFSTDSILNKQYHCTIPYEYLKLYAGTYNLQCNIELANKQGKSLTVLHKFPLRLKLPQLYVVEIDMKHLEVIDKKTYDVTSVFGQIFSRKGNTGKGYPDLYWEIYVPPGDRTSSSVEKNAYTCPPESVSLITVDYSGNLVLSVWDKDPALPFSKDDFISRTSLPSPSSEFEKDYNNKVFGNVECSFTYGKKKYDPFNLSKKL